MPQEGPRSPGSLRGAARPALRTSPASRSWPRSWSRLRPRAAHRPYIRPHPLLTTPPLRRGHAHTESRPFPEALRIRDEATPLHPDHAPSLATPLPSHDPIYAKSAFKPRPLLLTTPPPRWPHPRGHWAALGALGTKLCRTGAKAEPSCSVLCRAVPGQVVPHSSPPMTLVCRHPLPLGSAVSSLGPIQQWGRRVPTRASRGVRNNARSQTAPLHGAAPRCWEEPAWLCCSGCWVGCGVRNVAQGQDGVPPAPLPPH